MKFVCPSCKAKYQIADERVAGRSVKMKCRACGHVIQINEVASIPPPRGDTTGSLRSPALPSLIPPHEALSIRPQAGPEDGASDQADKGSSHREGERGSAALPVRLGPRLAVSVLPSVPRPEGAAAFPQASGRRNPDPVSASEREPASPGSAGVTAGRNEPAVRPAHPSIARPGLIAGVGQGPGKSGAAARVAEVLPAPRVALPPRAGMGREVAKEGGTTPRPPPRPGSLLRQAPPKDAKRSSSADADRAKAGLAAASAGGARAEHAASGPSKEAVLQSPDGEAGRVQASTHEAALDPVEPPRVHPLGALAASFSVAVHAPAALEELKTAANDWYVGINGVQVGPIRLGELRSKAAAGAITVESLVWRDGFEDWKPLKLFPELVAIVEESVASRTSGFFPAASPGTPSAAASPGPVPAPAGTGQEGVSQPIADLADTGRAERLSDYEAIAGLPRRRPNAAAWLAVVTALGLGITVGFVVFSQSETRTIVRYVEVPASGAAPAAAPAADLAARAEEVGKGQDPVEGAGNGKLGGGSRQAKSDPKRTQGLKGLGDLQGLRGGPAGPSGGPGTTGGSGQPLDSDQVQQTVRRYTGSVKRACWQPALDTRETNAPSSARVTVSIKVAPSGGVESVSTSGDPRGYHGLASCISGRVRGWQFPASSDATNVNVPFVFAAQ